jgi:hypothetical protein
VSGEALFFYDMTLRRRLINSIAEWGVEDRLLPGREDGFSCLRYGGKEFAHFHNDNELDLRLGKVLIEREGLAHPPNSKNHPNRKKTSPWIELRFETPKDLERVLRLVKLAIEGK